MLFVVAGAKEFHGDVEPWQCVPGNADAQILSSEVVLWFVFAMKCGFFSVSDNSIRIVVAQTLGDIGAAKVGRARLLFGPHTERCVVVRDAMHRCSTSVYWS